MSKFKNTNAGLKYQKICVVIFFAYFCKNIEKYYRFEATIKVTGAEFNTALLERIRALLNDNTQNYEFEIQVTAKRARPTSLRTETRVEYFNRLEKSIHDVQVRSGNSIVFENLDDFEVFVDKINTSNSQNSI